MDRPPKSKSVQRLQRLLDAIRELQSRPRGSSEFEKWRRDTAVAISNTFPDRPGYQEDFVGIRYRPRAVWSGMSESEYQRAYVGGLQSAAASLASMVDEIREYWEDDEPAATPTATAREQRTTNEVFVVHGTDEGAKDAWPADETGSRTSGSTNSRTRGVRLSRSSKNTPRSLRRSLAYSGRRGRFAINRPTTPRKADSELGFFLGKLGDVLAPCGKKTWRSRRTMMESSTSQWTTKGHGN